MKFSLYLEGIKVPFSSLTLQPGGLSITGTHPFAFKNIAPFTTVQLFVEFHGKEMLLFDGFVIATGSSGVSCMTAHRILDLLTIAVMEPTSYIFSQDATYLVHGKFINLSGFTDAQLNPKMLLKGEKSISQLFQNFYDMYALGFTEAENASMQVSKLGEFVKPYRLPVKTYTVNTANAVKLLELKVMENLFSGALQNVGSYASSVLQLLIQLLANFYYTLIPQIAPAKKDNIIYSMLISPDLCYVSPPKCNLLSSPFIHATSFNYARDWTRYPTRFTVIGQLTGTNIQNPLAIKPDSLMSAIEGKPADSGKKLNNFFYILTSEEQEPGRAVIPMVEQMPSMLASLLSSTDDQNEKDALNAFWEAYAEYKYTYSKDATAAISIAGGFNPFLMVGFPAVVVAPDNTIYVGKLAEINYNISSVALSCSMTVTPIWDRSVTNPLFPDLEQLVQNIYKAFGTAKMPESIPSGVTTSQDTYFDFVSRDGVSIKDFVNFMNGSGDQYEYTYDGMSKNRKARVRQLLQEVEKR